MCHIYMHGVVATFLVLPRLQVELQGLRRVNVASQGRYDEHDLLKRWLGLRTFRA